MGLDTDKQNEAILERLLKNPHLRKYVDPLAKIPRAFKGHGEIRLLVLGQDPTLYNRASEMEMRRVMNLDRDCPMRRYLVKICAELEFDLEENVYAAYIIKNFFVDKPADLGKKGIEVIGDALEYWLPSLQDELAAYPHVPAIVFDDIIIKHIVHHGRDNSVRDYWNYTSDWREKPERRFRFIKAEDNRLRRPLFPFPQEANYRAEFYQSNLSNYIKFMLGSCD